MNLTDPIRFLAAVAPITGTGSPELEAALERIETPLKSDTLVEAAITIVLLGGLITIPLAVIWSPAVAVSCLAVAAAAALLLIVGPRWLARTKETRALGELPDLIGFAVLRLHIDPSPELAAEFAATHVDGPLARSLHRHVTRAEGTPDSGWTAFAATWASDAPALPRVSALLTAASRAAPADRPALLQDALSAMLEGTRTRMATFATALRGPTTAVYAFGIVLPLATIGAIPTLRAAGIPVDVTTVAIVYDVLLPIGLVSAGAWLIARRPAAFPPATVHRTHPDLPHRRRPLILAVIGTAVVTGTITTVIYPGWVVYLATPTVTTGVALVVWNRPARHIRDEIRQIEDGLPAVLTIIGQRLSRGRPLETAIEDAANAVDGPTGTAFTATARIHRHLGVPPDAAFTGPHGALRHVTSPRLTACATLLAVAGREGPHGGRVVIDVADHMDAITTVQADARRELGTILGTLRSTAWCFAPLIGGVTVALAGRIDATGLTRSITGIDQTGLALAVGTYVVLLAAILAGLAAALDRGLDRPVIGEQIGYALVSAGIIYPTTVLATGWLV